MTKQTINRGTAANDGTGDNLRAGAAKVNENFDELYSVLGDGTTLQPGNYITDSSTSVLTNKSISGSSNTITNIPNSALSNLPNSKLDNSSITITGDGSQTSAVDLGDTLTIEGGTGITTSVSADKVSIAIDGAVLTESSTDVLTNKTIDGGTNTLQNISNASLTNQSVSYGGILLNLGGVDATPAFDLTDATNYPTSSLSGTITNAQLDGSIANDKLANKKITIVDDTSATADINLGENLEIAGGTGISTAVSPNKITLNIGGIANSSLTNDSITLGSDTIALGDTKTSIAGLSLTGAGTVDLTGAGSKIRFDFAGYGSLPTASTYVGMYAYDSTGNRPYYSSGAGWVRILDENSSVSVHTDVNISGVADKNVLEWSSAQGRFNVASQASAKFEVSNNGSSNYLFDGDGFSTQRSNPTLYLKKGLTYEFVMNASGHPFRIQSTSGTSGTVYNDGVTSNGAETGSIVFTVNMDAPSTLYYQCTSHSAMNGTIIIS